MISDELSEVADDLTNAELEALAELHRGMVRASFGIYNDSTDVAALADAVQHICDNMEFYQQQYNRLPNGDYHHKTFNFEPATLFCASAEANRWLEEQIENESGGL